jgi:TAG lipase/steryl ester hydrolase/phospholipase A2/LPA acyltransferase
MTLFEQDLLPNIIVGSSAGSLVAAGLCTFKRHELENFKHFEHFHRRDILAWHFDSTFDKINAFMQSYTIGSSDQLKLFARDLCQDLTFLEVYEENGWALSITVTAPKTREQRVLNHLTAPHVVIWSAAAASCSIPDVYDAFELMMKNEQGQLEYYHPEDLRKECPDSRFDYVDGSVSRDLPLARIKQLFNVNTCIVSQCNPHSVPFLWDLAGKDGMSLVDYIVLGGKRLLCNEVGHLVEQMETLGLAGEGTRQAKAICRATAQADVIILPEVSLQDYGGLLTNI